MFRNLLKRCREISLVPAGTAAVVLCIAGFSMHPMLPMPSIAVRCSRALLSVCPAWPVTTATVYELSLRKMVSGLPLISLRACKNLHWFLP